MNILFLANHLNIGGISSYLLSLGKGLTYRSHKVYIASWGGELARKFKDSEMEFIPIPIKTKCEVHPKVLVSCAKLSRIIRQKNIDLIHANTRVTQVLAGLLNKFSGMPYVTTCHGFFKRNPGRRFFPLWGCKVIAISEPVREHLIQDFGVDKAKIRLIYNGIELDRFKVQRGLDKDSEKKKLGLGPGPLVGIIARLSDVKGHCYLLEAMRKVVDRIPDVQLLIVGDGKEKDNLLKLTRQLRLAGNVKFVVSVDDTAKILPVLDLFVMPSLQEGLGLAVMEAQAAGLPVVVSNIGGLNTLVKDGLNGRLVLPKDIDGLSLAIIELLNDSDKAGIFGENARRFMEENFSLDQMVRQTESVYKECLKHEDEGR